MELSSLLYPGLLAAMGARRLIELRQSRRNQQRLLAQGARLAEEPNYRWMVALHAGVLIGAGVEVGVLKRPLLPPLAATAGCILVFAIALRWWAIRALGAHWNVRVVASTHLGVSTGGPYRWIQHPNYLAVFLELAALPMVHTAWWTATLGTAAHIPVLWKRIALEESVLLADPAYRSAMGGKPRFIPNLWRRWARA